MKYSRRVAAITAVLCLALISTAVTAQQQEKDGLNDVVKRTDVYCTGFIADVPPQTTLQVVGAEKEVTKYSYAQGDVVFLNRGRGAGMKPGAIYYVIRPVGEVKHPFTQKRLGFYVRELGLVRVLEVQEHTSTAEVTVSCDLLEFGDLLKPYEEMNAPSPRDARPLARYSEGSGGTNGQIVMSPGFHENLSAHRLVYLDLGAQQDVRPGDYFTIYREFSQSEGIVAPPQGSLVDKKEKDYSSNRWRGGEYSIQGPNGSRAEVLKTRPPMPRKVVGELVVIKTENNTSVALITRTTGEVNIGDRVERSN
jgi:hypothetical protein